MKADKTLEEVWAWKDAIARKDDGLSLIEKIARIKKEAEALLQEYHLNLPTLGPQRPETG